MENYYYYFRVKVCVINDGFVINHVIIIITYFKSTHEKSALNNRVQLRLWLQTV